MQSQLVNSLQTNSCKYYHVLEQQESMLAWIKDTWMRNSGYFLSYVDGLFTSYARSFLASTHARFYKELDREMSKNGDFKKTFR